MVDSLVPCFSASLYIQYFNRIRINLVLILVHSVLHAIRCQWCSMLSDSFSFHFLFPLNQNRELRYSDNIRLMCNVQCARKRGICPEKNGRGNEYPTCPVKMITFNVFRFFFSSKELLTSTSGTLNTMRFVFESDQ